MIGQSISKNSLLLALFAAVTTASIAGTYLLTKDRIIEQETIAANKALLEIFPAHTHDNQPLNDTIEINSAEELGLKASDQAYNINVVRKNKQLAGYIFPVIAPDGYADKIKLLVGISTQGEISGVRVVQHRETPGLGDAIEIKKSDWVLGFNGKSLKNPLPTLWKVKKDNGEFDQFTGATITPRAVTKAVYKSLIYFQSNQEKLYIMSNQQNTITSESTQTIVRNGDL